MPAVKMAGNFLDVHNLKNINFTSLSANRIKPDQMEPRITFITLGVTDLSASARFYEQNFGWTRSDMSNDDIVFFQLGGMWLSLFSRTALAHDATVSPQGSGFKGFTLAHNVWSEQEVDDLVNSLRGKGTQVVKEPQKVFWGGYSSYVADPDGNLWEIAYNPFLQKP